MKKHILKILICSLILLIGIGAVCAVENNSTGDVVASQQDGDVVAVQDDDVAIMAESEVSAAETDEVLAAESDDVDLMEESEASACESDDVLSVENNDVVAGEEGDVLAVADSGDVVSTSVGEDAKLTSSDDHIYIGYGSAYKTLKGKSYYKWKIKKSKWKKMKKQAVKRYKSLRKRGSSYPGYSNGVKVTVKIGGYKYRLTAFAVKNYRGLRCEVRGLGSYRLSTWGDYYV